MRFQQNWASGNDDIDKFIQDTQLSAHDDVNKALEWIPYNKLYDIEYITKDELGKVYRAIWIDGNIGENYYKFCSWSVNNNWIRRNPNMFVKLRSLTSPNDLTFELANKKFIDWTSGNDDIDKFIQDTQLSAHDKDKALEWITYDRFYDIKYIAKGGFGKIYRANLTDGFITRWDDINQNWKRNSKDMLVALKSLDDSKNIESEFINETMLHNKVRKDNNCIIKLYGITQDPETKNYMMVLDYAEDGSLRNYLDKEYSRLNWIKKIDYLRYIIIGLECIHEKELIHRDLHIGNILKLRYKTVITDMGLCKPANYNALENTKNNIYESSQLNISQLNISENESSQINASQLNINDNESLQIDVSRLNINENESLQIDISQLNVNENGQNNESESKRKNCFLSQNNESERKKIRIE
ncbi:kinase-like protein [Rhizophagus irregularis]|uniref:non-specific serine/threonine protein kinase n=1 Tax=Rhizophagus irregularis TaxID=588596 RepID=A0A2I1HCM6_9GLOM|nr:kinase-like protein [Rhizophagus irregularis]